MDSFIKPDNTWLLWAIILAGVALSIWLEQNFSWAAKVSGPVVALVLAMLLSNFKIMPTSTEVETIGPNGSKLVQAPDGSREYVSADTNFDELEKTAGKKVVKSRGVYEVVMGDLVPLALPLLLFRANLVKIFSTTGWLFVAFHIATVGTIVGAFLGAFAIRSTPNVDQLAGIMTGSYIGGGINFFAVAETYRTNGTAISSLLVADSFVMAAMFLVLLLIAGSKWAKRLYPHPFTADAVDSKQLAAEHWRRKEISLFDIAAALAVAVAIVATAKFTAGWVKGQLGEGKWTELAGNVYLHITTWSMLVATFATRFLTRIHGADELGSYLLYVFLFVIGLPADLWEVLTNAPEMLLLCVIIAVVNLVITLVVGWLFRFNLEHLLISVNATLGGPPSAAAMAISRGWSDLVLPAILVGIWGYAIGTACGLTVGGLVRQWFVG
jgi:uncharacterized membrane protein